MEIKNISHIETKSADMTAQNIFSDNTSIGYFLSPQLAYFLYGISDALADACERIIWATIQIKPQLQEIKTGEYITDHPMLELIEHSDMRWNKTQLLSEMMLSYLLCGEFFPVIQGNVKYEPVGLFHYPANNVGIAQGSDGYIGSMICNYQNIAKVYERAINPRYQHYVFNDKEELNQVMHILQIKKRNYLRAQSPLERIYYQAVMKYYGNIHNSNMLKNPTRPGGLWSPKDGQMSQGQHESFKKEVRDNFTGPANTARNIISAVPIEYQDFLINTRDMDFKELIEKVDRDIYQQYQIPLPLVTTDAATYSNYVNAISAFYDIAVLPRAGFFYFELGDFLLSRYKDGSKFRLVIDERQIPALKERLYTRSQSMRNVYAFSENEIRNEAGYENRLNGDVILQPATLIANGMDDYTGDSIQYDTQQEMQTEEGDETENTDESTDIIEDDQDLEGSDKANE
jgi:phage portal protein BeeE